jgi:hypothetical protein
MKKINEKKHKKNGNVLRHYLCIGFSLVIQQQQKTSSVAYDEKIVSKS